MKQMDFKLRLESVLASRYFMVYIPKSEGKKNPIKIWVFLILSLLDKDTQLSWQK